MGKRRGITGSEIVAVDMFCGAAGLSYGLQKSGISVGLGVDLDEDCQWVYEHNIDAEFLQADVAELKPAQLRKYLPRSSYTLVAGCAPCQRFSKYTQKVARADRQRWRLVDSFGRLADELRPDILTIVNAGYHIWHSVVDCHDYGTPQTRRRLVLLASRLGPIKLLSPSALNIRKKTVRDAIAGLPVLRAGSRNPRDALHRSQALSEINMRRMLASTPGKTWREWPEELVLKCHAKKSGKGYSSVYGRMEWDKPAPTITTNVYNYGSGRFGHPTQARTISLREAALLQTFPRHYKFTGRKNALDFRSLSRLIGNAVPVALGRAIGKSIVHHVNGVDPDQTGPIRTRQRARRRKRTGHERAERN
jgi:DNA (cytosine-5)-methyltransferase 1